jgi:hypothetical protein
MVKFKGFSNEAELERRNKKKVKSEIHEKRTTKELQGREKKPMRTSSSRTPNNMCSVTIVQVTSNQANKFRLHANVGKDQTNKLSATFHHDSTW